MEREQKAIIEGLVTTVAGLFPVTAAITNIYNIVQATKKEARLEEFLSGIAERINTIEGRVNIDFIKHEDFEDLFELTGRLATQERVKSKRDGFRNILLNGAITKDPNIELLESYANALSVINETSMILISTLHSPSNEVLEIKLDERNIDADLETPLGLIFPEWGYEKTQEAIHLLTTQRLILNNRRSEGHPGDSWAVLGKSCVTDKGLGFVDYIRNLD